MEKPLVSVIVPVYNAVQYLTQCLDSILGQTYKNLEIILVNDGSTDESGKVCDDYKKKDSRVVVIHQENRGVSSARNNGLKHMTGEWLCFVDADDVVQTNYIEYLYNLANTFNAEVSACGYTKINRNDIYKVITNNSNEYTFFSAAEAIEDMLYKKKISTYCCAKMFRKKAIKQVFFQEDLKVAEDFDFTIRILENVKKVVYGSQNLYLYIQNLTSCMHGTDWEKYSYAIKNFEKMKESILIKNELRDAYVNFQFIAALGFYSMSTKWYMADNFKKELIKIIGNYSNQVSRNKKGKAIHRLLGVICCFSPKLGAELCRLARNLNIQPKKAI